MCLCQSNCAFLKFHRDWKWWMQWICSLITTPAEHAVIPSLGRSMTFWAPWDETIEVGVGFHLLICSWDLYINRLAIHWHGCYRRFGTEFVNLQLVAVPTLFTVCQILIAPACNFKIGWQILMTISSRPMSKTCKTHGPWSVSRPAACSPKPFLGPWTRRSGSIRAVMCFAPVWGFTFFQPTFWHRVSYGPFKLQPSKFIWVQGTTTCLTFGYGFQFFKSNCEVTAKVICVRHSPQNVYFA